MRRLRRQPAVGCAEHRGEGHPCHALEGRSSCATRLPAAVHRGEGHPCHRRGSAGPDQGVEAVGCAVHRGSQLGAAAAVYSILGNELNLAAPREGAPN